MAAATLLPPLRPRAKEEVMRTAQNYIVARGRKGGSNVAAAIVNAVLYQLIQREE